jgi:uncharacterized membrane protein YobD (UPF0266 family)
MWELLYSLRDHEVMDHLKGKVMLEVSFDWQGIMHHEFVQS